MFVSTFFMVCHKYDSVLYILLLNRGWKCAILVTHNFRMQCQILVIVSPAETAVEMQTIVGPRNHVLDDYRSIN